MVSPRYIHVRLAFLAFGDDRQNVVTAEHVLGVSILRVRPLNNRIVKPEAGSDKRKYSRGFREDLPEATWIRTSLRHDLPGTCTIGRQTIARAPSALGTTH